MSGNVEVGVLVGVDVGISVGVAGFNTAVSVGSAVATMVVVPEGELQPAQTIVKVNEVTRPNVFMLFSLYQSGG